MLKLAEPYVLSINPYIPSRPIDDPAIDLSWAFLGSNENCLGPSPMAAEAAQESLKLANLYPNALRFKVTNALCEHFAAFGVKPNNIALGNGSSELIVNLVRSLVAHDEAVLFPNPSFVMYRLATRAHGRKEVAIDVDSSMRYDLNAMTGRIKSKEGPMIKLVFLGNPNNPTGDYLNEKELAQFIGNLPDHVVLVIDEAYFEYVVESDYPNGLNYALKRSRTLVLRTFSKVFGLAGLRIGYAIGDEKIIDILGRIRDPFNVNIVAQQAAIAALRDDQHVQRSIEHNLFFKPILMNGLKKAGFKVYDSVGNFVLAKRAEGMPQVEDLCRALFVRGLVIRGLEDFGLSDHVRVSVGNKQELAQLFKGLEEVL